MILINEWLANPAGSDAAGEWMELWNSGNASVRLDSWSVGVSSGKKFSLSGKEIPAGGFLVVRRAESKLTLKNTDEAVSLYDANGVRVGQSAFLGSAPEGKSWSRLPGGQSGFSFAAPTPGAKNTTAGAVSMIEERLPHGGIAGGAVEQGNVWLMAAASALAISALIFFAVKNNAYFSELFFEGN